jgi:hypothetical protein
LAGGGATDPESVSNILGPIHAAFKSDRPEKQKFDKILFALWNRNFCYQLTSNLEVKL